MTTNCNEYEGLQQDLAARAARREKLQGYAYTCLEEFVLKHGEKMEWALKPKGVRYGKPGFCYTNATKLAYSSDRFIYCEGFASSNTLGFSIPHAWCYDTETGHVVDNTWRLDERRAYLGVRFPNRVLATLLLMSADVGQWGIINNAHLRWPLLREPMPDFWDDSIEGVGIVDAWLERVTVVRII